MRKNQTGLLLFDKLSDELEKNNGNYKIVSSKFRLNSAETKKAANELSVIKRILGGKCK